MLVQLEENPLGPLVIAGVGGVHAAVPVKGVAQHVELPGEVFNVLLGNHRGVDVIFDGKVLGGQTKGVVPDGEQYVVAVHPLLPGDDVHSGIGPGVAHMEARSGGVGKLHQPVELGLAGVPGLAGKGFLILPSGLPLLLNGGKIVLQC